MKSLALERQPVVLACEFHVISCHEESPVMVLVRIPVRQLAAVIVAAVVAAHIRTYLFCRRAPLTVGRLK